MFVCVDFVCLFRYLSPGFTSFCTVDFSLNADNIYKALYQIFTLDEIYRSEFLYSSI